MELDAAERLVVLVLVARPLGDLDQAVEDVRHERETTPMIKEFRDFIMRGNVVDLAVAVVIGAAFGAVVKSLVDDIAAQLRTEIEHFFSIYKQPEGKIVEVDGWYPKDDAITEIQRAHQRWQDQQREREKALQR